MSTCEDCIHYDVCVVVKNRLPADKCGCYADKSLYVKLPCKVGDTIYYIVSNLDNEICPAVVTLIEINYYTPQCPIWLRIEYDSTIIGKHERHLRADILFGKTVFLTREEAAKALEERAK